MSLQGTVGYAVLLGIGLGAARGAAQQPAAKLDPRLRPFLDPGRALAAARAPSPAAAAAASRLPLANVLVFRHEPGSAELFVDVFVSLTERSPEIVEQLGGRLSARAGSLIGARVPVSALGALAADPRVRYVQAAPPLKTTNDLAVVDIRADRVRTLQGTTFSGVSGRGVIVGILDTGIDWAHQDFKNPDGTTRLLYVWDQTTSGTPPGDVGGVVFNRGHECSAAAINGGSCPERDVQGHGSHVAGSAAGDGSAGGGFQYAGVAPHADLIAVKVCEFDCPLLNVIEGLEYVFKRAELLGRPAVVNLSLGTIFGSHDGSLAAEQSIDSLAGPGRIVVVAAGNDGSNPTAVTGNSPVYLAHATRALAAPGDTARLTIDVPVYSASSGSLNDYMLFNLWYDGRDSLTITVTRPNGTSFSRRTGDPVGESDDPQGHIFLDNASAGASPANGDHEAEIEIYDLVASQTPSPGTWRITIRLDHLGGSGRFDVWQYSASFASPFTGGGDNAYLVNSPGNAARAITVGAHVTRVNWTSVAGNFQFVVREQIGDLATFSASGPTRPVRDAPSRQKPELTAPGKGVFSALSANITPPRALIATDGVHVLEEGTSMATPMVTGGVALMLEIDPTLTPEDVRSILIGRARQDGFTGVSYAGFGGGVPNPSWGYGKLDVEQALASIPVHLTVTSAAGLPRAPLRIGDNAAILFRLAVSSLEAVRLDTIVVSGEGTGALGGLIGELALYASASGTIPSGPPLATVPQPFGTGSTARFTNLNTTLGVSSQTTLLLVGRITDQLRQGQTLTLRIEGVRGQALASARPATAYVRFPVQSDFGPGSLLEASETFLISENPVRDGRVIFSYTQTPQSIAIYNFAGLKVREFTRLPANGFEWDVRGESPGLPNGMYLVVVEVGDKRARQRLMILSPAR